MFQQHQQGSLVYLTSSLLDSPGLRHCFSTRQGGVSQGSRASLNLGLRGDTRENVLQNYEILGGAIGFQPEDTVFTCQVHSDAVRAVTRADRGLGLFRPVDLDCDALMTNDSGVMLAAFSADCCTILLHCRASGAVAAVHSGWRGTALGIVKKTVEAMAAAYGADPAQIYAAIGQCIGQCCFETDADVPEAMVSALGEAAKPAITVKGPKYHVDLKALNRTWLRLAGVPDGQIDTCQLCTVCQPELFFSHRRSGQERGSLAALIGKFPDGEGSL